MNILEELFEEQSDALLIPVILLALLFGAVFWFFNLAEKPFLMHSYLTITSMNRLWLGIGWMASGLTAIWLSCSLIAKIWSSPLFAMLRLAIVVGCTMLGIGLLERFYPVPIQISLAGDLKLVLYVVGTIALSSLFPHTVVSCVHRAWWSALSMIPQTVALAGEVRVSLPIADVAAVDEALDIGALTVGPNGVMLGPRQDKNKR